MRPPNSWATARVTLALTLITAAAMAVLTVLRLEDRAVAWGAFVPARLSPDIAIGGAPVWLTPLTATLVHANWIHLAFNLLILVFCGRPTEAVVGPFAIAVMYVVGAYAAAAAHLAVDPTDVTPMIGASGAVSAVIGAYAILFGRNKVKVASPRLAMWLNALWLMAAWVALQLVVGFTFAGRGLNVAIAAHIGGFLVGVALANPLLLFRYRRA
ncbi:MAG TPA: rhomboid family intramembrane serine protease [Allosphingosinicella sp.]|jgi:membrane associated rhomboid family serine protease